jgi:hypothetical protein
VALFVARFGGTADALVGAKRADRCGYAVHALNATPTHASATSTLTAERNHWFPHDRNAGGHSDYYGDELPIWTRVNGKPHLIVPYSLTNNDGKFAGWLGTSDDWFSYIRDAFDMLYEEGRNGQPKMMSVGLHMRLIGHPARAVALQRLLDYMAAKRDVWITRRVDIARHWMTVHPAR